MASASSRHAGRTGQVWQMALAALGTWPLPGNQLALPALEQATLAIHLGRVPGSTGEISDRRLAKVATDQQQRFRGVDVEVDFLATLA